MKVETKTKETTFIVDGLKGRAYIWYSGKGILASADHKQLLPLGATQDETCPSCYSIRNPTSEQMAIFLRNLADA